jgi:hypothetical protein
MDRDVLSLVSESSARAGLTTAASGTLLQQTAIGWLVLRLTGLARHDLAATVSASAGITLSA